MIKKHLLKMKEKAKDKKRLKMKMDNQVKTKK
jgi:hypothetical protein